MHIQLDEPLRLYNKQWKRIFTITHTNEHFQLIDEIGIIHDPRALREVRPGDEEPFRQI